MSRAGALWAEPGRGFLRMLGGLLGRAMGRLCMYASCAPAKPWISLSWSFCWVRPSASRAGLIASASVAACCRRASRLPPLADRPWLPIRRMAACCRRCCSDPCKQKHTNMICACQTIASSVVTTLCPSAERTSVQYAQQHPRLCSCSILHSYSTAWIEAYKL